MPDGCIGTDTLCDFLEGRADPDARRRVEDHASRCAACRELLSSLARSGPPPAAPRPANAEVALAPGTVVGRYVIEREIGAGGMGVVYTARDPQLGRLVAVKVLRGGTQPSTEERIRREAQAMARLAHPNVVAVHDVGTFEDRIFVAMEYVAGTTLARWNAAPRSPREILDAYFAAGRGLSAAHAAGIVHRDFKPENVFVGQDGRVRVGDFGVARTTAAIGTRYAAVPASGVAALPASGVAALPSETDAPDKPARLTAPGTLLGTPYYIAPELYDGADADARSDQFSFCVALFTTLYGERPFEGDTFTTLASNVRAGRIRRARASGVPRRIHAAIRRGLSADPAARFRSLRDLIAELRPAPQRRLGRTAVIAGGALAVGLAAVAWRGYLAAGAPDEPCTGAPGLAAAWTGDARAAIAAAFTRSGAPYAAVALRRVSEELDRQAARWAQADDAACRDARIAGRADAALAARTRCLEPRRHDAAALIDALAAADRPAIARAVAAVTALRDPLACADPAVVRRLGAPPASAATGERLGELTRGLSRARAALATGALASARQLAQPIVASAHALGDRPLEAEAELVAGAIARALGDADAERMLMNASWSAEAGLDDAAAARARTWLVAVVGLDRADPARALALVPLATAAIARLGGSPDLQAELETALGAIAIAQGDLDAAVDHLEAAVALDRRADEDGLAFAGALDRLATAVLAQGNADRAVDLAQQSRERFERWLGGDHPDVAAALHHLGNARAARGDLAAAETDLRRAAAIREHALGPDDASLASNLSDLARVVRRQGRGEQALALARSALAIGERALGPVAPALAGPLVELAIGLARADRHADADAQLRRAEANLAAEPHAAPLRAMPAVLARGELLLLQARWRDAAAIYERALSVLGAHGARDPRISAELGLARARVELHQPARAAEPLERLSHQLPDLPPELRGAIEFALARALWDTGGDRARARELATRALADLRALADARPADVAQLEQWLASHR